jgi:hypothetical protein
MLAYMIGVAGIWAGFGALALNVTAMRAAPTSQDARNRRLLMIWASVLGLAICPVTFVIGFQGVTIEGPVLDYGWPFAVSTTDRFAAPIGRDRIVGNLGFWVLAPQILVLVYERRFRRRG